MTILDLHDEPNSGDAAAAAADAAATAAAANPDPAKATVPGEGEGKGADPPKAGEAAPLTDEAKAAADKAAADAKAAEDAEKAAKGAPEAYEAFTLPEGFELEGERLTQAHTLFKELDLPQAKAQKLAEAFVKYQAENIEAIKGAIETGGEHSLLTDLVEAKRAKDRDQWGAESKTRFGDKFAETTASAKVGVIAIEPDLNGPLHKAFNELGWGNHPELLNAFAVFGNRIGGDSMEGLGANNAANQHATRADKIYDKTP